MATTFGVLSEPARREILDLLREQPRSVGELVGLLGLTQPGTSKHLRVLREAGLVSVRRDAQRRMYQLQPEPLAEIDAWLDPFRQLWSDRFDALADHLDTMAEPTVNNLHTSTAGRGSLQGNKSPDPHERTVEDA